VDRIGQIDRLIEGASLEADLILPLLVPCHTREPQSGQKKQVRDRPVSVGRVQCLSLPVRSRTSALRATTEIPKAEADCFWHSRQWQT
jgi:hypothetical protein